MKLRELQYRTPALTSPVMVIIRFPDAGTERRALGYLAGRFAGKTWAHGDTMVPEEALAHLAAEGIEFTVKGRPSYAGEHASLRNPAAAPL